MEKSLNFISRFLYEPCIEYQISIRASTLMSIWVQVRVLLLWNSRVEYEKLWIPEIQHLSTEYKYSSPAFDHTHVLGLGSFKVRVWNSLSSGMGQLSCQHSISQPPVHPCFAWAIKLIAHPKIPQFLHFYWDFLQKWHFAPLKFHLHSLSCRFWLNLWLPVGGCWGLFTQGQFWPSGIVVACVCVCPCVRQSRVCQRNNSSTSCHQPFKLGSLNLDQRCKRPWLSALLFCGMIDRDLQGQIEPQRQNLPLFELVYAITHHQLKLQFPNLEQKCI